MLGLLASLFHKSVGRASSAPGFKLFLPDEREVVVAEDLPDGYWLEAFYFDKDAVYPDLIGYGLGLEGKPATITLYVNPKNAPNSYTDASWAAVAIQTMDFPVALCIADLTGDGRNDIIICDRYGPTMDDLWDANDKNGGRVQWLRNPGSRSKGNWKASHIGNSTGMHRLKVGHFTTPDHFQVFAFPIISRSSDLTSPAPVILFTPEYGSDPSDGPQSWHEDIIFDKEFRLIHDIAIVPGSAETPSSNHTELKGVLDTALVAGREGICYLYYSQDTKKWEYVVIGEGLSEEKGNPYWGSGSVSIGAVNDDPVGFIATCEAFHGNVVSVYIKNSDAPKGRDSLLKGVEYWTRVVLDDTKLFGPLDPKQHTGTIHHVAAADFDGSGVDAFAIACIGAPVGKPENEGVYIYRPTDIKNGTFTRVKVTHRSASRLAIAPFFDKDKLDLGSISYYVPGYHTGPERPSIRINPNAYLSRVASPPALGDTLALIAKVKPRTDIRAHRLDKEVLLLVPRPATLHAPDDSKPQRNTAEEDVRSMAMIAVAGYCLHVYVLAPDAEVKLGKDDAVKVMFGEIVMKDSKGNEIRREIAPERYGAATTKILSDDGTLSAGSTGAVFLRMEHLSDASQGPFHNMKDLPIENAFPKSKLSSASPLPASVADPDVTDMEFAFAKVDTLDWAGSGKWDGFEFYNMTGFHVMFGDDTMEKICHSQLWTLGLGETARFHLHDTIPFCEIHCCITNGGDTAGMRYFPDSTTSIDESAELTEPYVSLHTSHLPVPALHEHGPLWKVQPGSCARPQLLPNGCADYPWHAWLAGEFGKWGIPIDPPLEGEEQRYDVWLAFEFPIPAFQY
ncbi:hypothetical protein GY45DRAFT_1438646 [Cubamyces sp. BRFM 1775]|nr:hypothetical protein GY45DRAFT_1438646 [Cubamyces sp. BRFM 1775]